MKITKEELLKIGKKLIAEAKHDGTKEYQEGYSDGVLDVFNELNKIVICPLTKKMV
jgi:hypothetical protein